MIKFNKFEDVKPPCNVPILIKFKNDDDIDYYFVQRERIKNWNNWNDKYVEFLGEGYASWDEEELEGWCFPSEIKDNEKWN